MAKTKVKNNFGKGVDVKAIAGEHSGVTGTTMSDGPDKDGIYVIRKEDNSVVGVHANDLALANEDNSAAEENERTYVITEAKIKDDYCHYSWLTIAGVEKGGNNKTDIDNEITDDLRKAFERFNVHLACVDDVFKHAGIEIDDIDKYHGDSLPLLYSVTGFKVYGEEENEGVMLIGSKYVSLGGRMDSKTPKIALDNLSSYKWYNELKAAVDTAKLEVSLYKEGKFIMPEPEEQKPNLKQMKITDMLDVDSHDAANKMAAAGEWGEEGEGEGEEGADEDFENARL